MIKKLKLAKIGNIDEVIYTVTVNNINITLWPGKWYLIEANDGRLNIFKITERLDSINEVENTIKVDESYSSSGKSFGKESGKITTFRIKWDMIKSLSETNLRSLLDIMLYRSDLKDGSRN